MPPPYGTTVAVTKVTVFVPASSDTGCRVPGVIRRCDSTYALDVAGEGMTVTLGGIAPHRSPSLLVAGAGAARPPGIGMVDLPGKVSDMHMSRFLTLALGMAVLGADGTLVGHVKEVVATYLLIDRSAKRDVYAPFGAIQALRHNQIVLAVPAAQVDEMHWPQPPLFSL